MCCQLMDQELNEYSNLAAELGLRMISIRSNMNRPIFSSDYPIPIRGIPLAPHHSIITIAIPFHWMAVCQHHSNVVLQSHGTCLMRCNITCLSGFFCSVWIVCSTSCCTVTRIVFFRLYCWRVRLFRFFFWCESCWVTIGGGSNNLTASGVGVTICWVAEIGKNNLALDTSSSLVINLFFIACISRLSLSIMLFIIACTTSIVTNVSAIWFVDILLRLVGISLNDRMA